MLGISETASGDELAFAALDVFLGRSCPEMAGEVKATMTFLALQVPGFEPLGRERLRAGSLTQSHDEGRKQRLRTRASDAGGSGAICRALGGVVVGGGGFRDGDGDVIGDERGFDAMDLSFGRFVVALGVSREMLAFGEVETALLAFVTLDDAVFR